MLRKKYDFGGAVSDGLAGLGYVGTSSFDQAPIEMPALGVAGSRNPEGSRGLPASARDQGENSRS